MANPKKTEKQWRKLVSQWERSGLNAGEFAATRGNLHPRTSTWWASKLRRDAREQERTGSGEPPASAHLRRPVGRTRRGHPCLQQVEWIRISWVGIERWEAQVEVMTGKALSIQNRRFDGFVDQGVIVLAADSTGARTDLFGASQRSPSRQVHRQDSTSTV